MERLGGRVKLRKPVIRIDQSGESVVVETLDHELYEVMKSVTFKQLFVLGWLENLLLFFSDFSKVLYKNIAEMWLWQKVALSDCPKIRAVIKL